MPETVVLSTQSATRNHVWAEMYAAEFAYRYYQELENRF